MKGRSTVCVLFYELEDQAIFIRWVLSTGSYGEHNRNQLTSLGGVELFRIEFQALDKVFDLQPISYRIQLENRKKASTPINAHQHIHK